MQSTNVQCTAPCELSFPPPPCCHTVAMADLNLDLNTVHPVRQEGGTMLCSASLQSFVFKNMTLTLL